MNCTDDFIKYISSIKKEKIPNSVYDMAKQSLLDYLGVTYAGSLLLKDKLLKYISCYDMEQGDAVAIGFEKRVPQSVAAIINGMSSHVAELDDGHKSGMLHLGTTIISALITVNGRGIITGRDFLYGIIVGYEAASSLARRMQPSHKQKGYHATGTCGTIGAALAIGAALGFNETEMKTALSASGTSASGLLEIQEDHSNLKPYNAGHAVLSGISSAYLAKAGFIGPDDILNGSRGFFRMLTNSADGISFPSNIQKYEILNIYQKAYASCRHSHSAVDAAILLRQKKQIPPHKIKQINIYTYRLAIQGHDHKSAAKADSAKMSIPYSVAIAYYLGHLNIEDFYVSMLTNKDIVKLVQQVYIYEDKDMSRKFPEKRCARVEIVATDGKKYVEEVVCAKGDPEVPFVYQDIQNKYISLMKYSGKSEDYYGKILYMVSNIEKECKNLMCFL